MFYYFKTGIVYSRISYLDNQIICITYHKTFKLRLLLEWCRHIHLDKSIKTKVAQMLKNSFTSLNTSFINMTKLQIDEYFNDRIEKSKETINQELVNIKLECNHYKNFIKQEMSYMKSKIEHKYPLRIKFDISSILPFNSSNASTKEDIFHSAKDLLRLPSKICLKGSKTLKDSHPSEFMDHLKSCRVSNKPSIPKDRPNLFNSNNKTSNDNLTSLTEKELIHKSLHNFQ